jgi:tRNA(adenine34) deaminase
MYRELEKPWQVAVEMAWTSFMEGSIPIGASLYHGDQLVAKGRNRIYESSETHPLADSPMAHAEMTTLMVIKRSQHPNIRDYKLYTTMEPCPMCFGTMLMMHIQHLEFGAYDEFAGALTLKEGNAYVRKKTLEVTKGPELIEHFQVTVQTANEYFRQHKYLIQLTDAWSRTDDKAVRLGKKLFDEGYFHTARENSLEIEEVFNYVIKRYKELV